MVAFCAVGSIFFASIWSLFKIGAGFHHFGSIFCDSSHDSYHLSHFRPRFLLFWPHFQLRFSSICSTESVTLIAIVKIFCKLNKTILLGGEGGGSIIFLVISDCIIVIKVWLSQTVLLSKRYGYLRLYY